MSSSEVHTPSSLTTVRADTKWVLGQLQPKIQYGENQKLLNSTVLKDFFVGTAWVQASLIKTGQNTRKTTKKGVRKMRKSLKTRGYMQNYAVVIYPGHQLQANDDSVHVNDGNQQIFTLSQVDVKAGLKFLCADGMHRVRCVVELASEKAAGAEDIKCDDMVYAIILRPDTPRQYLIQLSLGKYYAFS